MTQDVVYFWSQLCSVTLEERFAHDGWRHVTYTGQLVYCGWEGSANHRSLQAYQQNA